MSFMDIGHPSPDVTPPAPDASGPGREWHGAMLRELAEMGMSLARATHRLAEREAEGQAAALPPAEATARPGEAAKIFARISTTVRLAVALDARIAAGRMGVPKGFAHQMLRKMFRGDVRDAAEAGLDEAAVDDLRRAIEARLDDAIDPGPGETSERLVAEVKADISLATATRTLAGSMVEWFFPGAVVAGRGKPSDEESGGRRPGMPEGRGTGPPDG